MLLYSWLYINKDGRKMKFPKAIKIACIKKGITQSDLARKIGVERNTLTQTTNPSLKTVKRIADALEIKMSDLVIEMEGLE